MEDLSLVETNDLIKELMVRNIGGIIYLVTDLDSTRDLKNFIWWGGLDRALGCVQLAQWQLYQTMRDGHKHNGCPGEE